MSPLDYVIPIGYLYRESIDILEQDRHSVLEDINDHLGGPA